MQQDAQPPPPAVSDDEVDEAAGADAAMTQAEVDADESTFVEAVRADEQHARKERMEADAVECGYGD